METLKQEGFMEKQIRDEEPPAGGFRRRWSKSKPPDMSRQLAVVVLGDPSAVQRGPENILLGEESTHSTSRTPERRCEVFGRPLCVINILGLLHTDQAEETESLALRCLDSSVHGIHAFLLLVPVGQQTERVQSILQDLERAFGPQALDFTVLIITYGPEQRESLAGFLKDSQVRGLVESSQARVATCSCSMADQDELEKLFEEVDALPNRCYTRRMHQDAWLKAWDAEIEDMAARRKQLDVEHIRELKILRDERDGRIKKLAQELETLWTGGELRLVLLGMTGAGKTSTVKAILGEEAFLALQNKWGPTRECSVHSGTVSGRCVTVLDTPGFQHMANKDLELMKNIKRSCEQFLAPGPHAVLFVVRPDCVSAKDLEVLQMTSEVFGEAVLQHCLVVLSCMGQASGEGSTGCHLEGEQMQQLLKCCGDKYHLVELQDHIQVSRLLERVDEMVQNGGGEFYAGELEQPELSHMQEDVWISGLKKDLKAQCATLERREEELRRERNLIQSKEENTRTLRDAVAQDEEMLERHVKDAEQCRDQIAHLDENMAKVLQSIESLERDQEKAERERESLQAEKEAIAKEKLKLQQRWQELENRTKAIEVKEEMTRREREEMLRELEKEKWNLENEKERLAEKEKSIQRKQEALEQEVRMFEERMNDLKGLEERREQLGKEIGKKVGLVKEKEEEMETCRQAIEAQRWQMDVETGEILSLRERLKTNEDECEKTRADLQLRLEEVQKYESRLLLMWREVERRRKENQKLQAELARQREEMKRKDEEVQAYKEALRKLEEALTQKEKEKERDAREIQGYMEELRRLQEELGGKQREKEEELRKQKLELDRNQEKVHEVERRMKDQAEGQETGEGDMKNVLAAAETQKNELMAKMTREKERLRLLQEEYASSSREILWKYGEKIRMHRRAEEKKMMDREVEFKEQMEKLRRTLKAQQ